VNKAFSCTYVHTREQLGPISAASKMFYFHIFTLITHTTSTIYNFLNKSIKNWTSTTAENAVEKYVLGVDVK
jgi:hypothetical protein